jgi:hypothetical protein
VTVVPARAGYATRLFRRGLRRWLYSGQPQGPPPNGRCQGAVGSEEFREGLSLFFFGHAHSLVAYRELELSLSASCADGNLAVFGGEFDGIGQQLFNGFGQLA